MINVVIFLSKCGAEIMYSKFHKGVKLECELSDFMVPKLMLKSVGASLRIILDIAIVIIIYSFPLLLFLLHENFLPY